MRPMPALSLAIATLSVFALLTSDAGYARKKGGYKYSVAQCNAAFNRCYKWCSANRTGSELEKCQSNCIDYYANCMGARYRGTLPPGITGPNTSPPVERSP
jgi:hypothetical protein